MIGSRIQTQLSVILLLSVGAAVSLLFTVAVTQANAILHAQEGAADAEFVTTIKGTMESALDAAELALRPVAADPVVQELIARRDRRGLEKYLAPVYDSLRGHVSRFHVHLPDSVSFLRLHAPDEYGDNLSELRTMVAKANRELKIVRGLETGIHGLSLRVVMPVLQAERHLGSVEFGVDFGARLVDELLERRPAEYYLYRFGPDGVEELTIPAEGDPCPLEPVEMDRALEGEVFVYTTCSLRDRVLVVPLMDVSGIPVAFLKIVSDRSTLESALQLMRYRLSMLGILSTLGLTGVVALLLGRLLRPLAHIVKQTREIANGIAEGNADVGGAVRGSASDFRDIVAEINRVIGALRASEHQKRAILDGFPGMLYYVDAELNVLWANETVLEMRPDMVGKNCGRDFTGKSFFSCEQCILLDAIASQRIERGSSWFAEGSETGRSCWEYAAVPVLREDGTVGNIVMIAWDITEKMLTQEQLSELNENLEVRVREEVDRRKRQEQMVYQHAKLAAIGELSAGIAHEINQPLNTLSFAVENLAGYIQQTSAGNTLLAQKREIIETSTARIRRIIDHVRTFSREETEDFSERFRVNTVVQHAVSLIEAQYRAHGILLDIGYSPSDPHTEGDPHELEQVILNVLSNARYAVEHGQSAVDGGKRIDITVLVDEMNVRVMVKDTGDGISQEILDRVMEPFFTTKAPGEGTGLGLSISYGLVQKMGGNLDIRSSEGEGTLVTIRLPLLVAEKQVVARDNGVEI